jgi:hypothetical protein
MLKSRKKRDPRNQSVNGLLYSEIVSRASACISKIKPKAKNTLKVFRKFDKATPPVPRIGFELVMHTSTALNTSHKKREAPAYTSKIFHGAAPRINEGPLEQIR